MQHQTISRANSTGFRLDLRPLLRSPTAQVLIFALAVLALNPVGYKGGGADDWQYLQAARCAAEQGFCFPEDHWWRRFAIVVPAGLAIRLFGESQVTLAVFPLICGLGSIALFVRLVERQFGRREALIGGLVFAATPVIGERLLEINIDMAELVLLLGAVACLQSAHRTGRRWAFPAAGALIGVAILCRPTLLALLPIFAAAFWLVPDWRRRAAAFATGLVTPILVEAAVYAVWAGDALFPWKLSMAHTRIPSTELESTVDLSQSPLFNIAYIDGWKPSMGLSVHWTVDGLLNLLIHPGIGLSLVAALMLIGLDHRRLLSPEPRAKLLLFLIGASMAFFGALVYAFAIDPKPRMFLPVLAVACAAIGLLAAERLRTGNRLLVVACLSLLVVKGVVASWDRLRVDPVAATAAEWILAEPNNMAATPLASSLLTLTPEVRRLPVGQDARPKLLLLGATDCRSSTTEYPGWRVLREQLYTRREPQLVAEMRKARLLFQPTQVIALCLLERPAGSSQVGRGRL